MDNWAPVVRWPHEGVGYWTNDAGTLTLNTTGQNNLRTAGNSADTAAHDVTGNQWTDTYGEALFNITNLSGNTNRRLGVWLRVADASNCYTVQADGGSGGTGTITIAKVVAGTPTTLGTASYTLGGDLTFAIFRAEAQGDLIRAFWRGQHIVTVQDSTYTGPGFVSLYMRTTTTTGDLTCLRWEAGPLRPTYVSGYTPMAGPFRTGRLLTR